MSEINKLDEEDFRNFLNSTDRFEQSKQELAENEAHIDLLTQKKKSILINYHSSKENLSQAKADIIKKYGEININLGTGEYSKNEKISD